MSTEGPRLYVLGRAVLVIGAVAGLVWLVNLSVPGAVTDAPTISTAAPLATAKVAPRAAPAPRLGTPRGKELRTEDGQAHPFIERRYEPAHRLPLLAEPTTSNALSTPEDVVTSLASAIRQLDWQWFLALWDTESRTYMVDAMDQAGFAPAQRLAQWRRNYAGKEMQITQRIDMGGYALVSLSPTDGDAHTWSKVPPLATKRDPSGRWWLTHDLRAHPVLSMNLGLDPVTIIDRGVGP